MGGRERREVIEPCASKWEMKIQRGAAERREGWGREQRGLTKAIIIYSWMS